MPTFGYPNTGALAVAGAVQTLMAGSTLHLLGEQVPVTPTLSLETLEAAELLCDGYAAKTIADFEAPYLNPGGGAITSSPLEIFYYGPASSPTPVTGNCWGWWINDAAGNPVAVYVFDSPLPMAIEGDAVPITVPLIFGT